MFYTGLMTAFSPKWSILDETYRNIILDYAKENGAYKASRKYAEETEISQGGLYRILAGELKAKEEGDGVSEIAKIVGATVPPKEKEIKISRADKRIGGLEGGGVKKTKLSKEEKDFLRRLESGEASLADTSRFVAVRVFTQMLKNPDQFKFFTYYQTKFLELKQEETQLKDQRMSELVARMFAGKLPPQTCPSCGEHLYGRRDVLEATTVVEEGEVDEYPKPLAN